MREIIKDARNVEEAIDLACKELGAERDTVDFEIISLPKRGFLGLRNTPARVRVFINEPEKPAPRPKAPQPHPSRPARPAQESRPEPRREQRMPAQSQPKVEQKPKPQPQHQPKAEPRPQPKPEARPQPAAEKPAVVEQRAPEGPAPELKFVPAETTDGKARTAADYVRDVLAEMGVQADISVAFTENGIVLRLSGGGLGVIIGRRGETLDALQYLSGLVANRQEGDYMRVTIDSGNYREKRERTLQQLAQKLSASAIRYGRASTLEPMNPYERRIIHSTVSMIDGVSSSSIGEEPNRRVVISPTNPRPQQNRGGGSRGGQNGGNRSRPPRRDGDRPARPFEPRPEGARPFTPRPEGTRTFEPRPDGGRPFEPRGDRRPDNRPPRRDNRDGFRREGPPRDAVKPTSTAVDREYMKELEAVNAEKPKAAPAPAERAVMPEPPSRTQERAESKDLPLYGKIEL